MLSHLGVIAWMIVASAAEQAPNAVPPTAIDRTFTRLYNFDFPGAHAILDEHVRAHPEDPLAYSVRAAALMFSEFHRLKILEMEFFADDEKVTSRTNIVPDPNIRARLFEVTAQARKRAAGRLAMDARDRDALLALSMAAGVETDYSILVEKRYFRSFSLSKEAQQYAHTLLSLNPPAYDAYLTLGSVEYTVGSMNWFFRLFVHFDRIEGSKQKAVENLQKVVQGGRYYAPFAKLLLAIIFLRENQPQKALLLLQELARDFPQNPLARDQIARVTERINRIRKNGK